MTCWCQHYTEFSTGFSLFCRSQIPPRLWKLISQCHFLFPYPSLMFMIRTLFHIPIPHPPFTPIYVYMLPSCVYDPTLFPYPFMNCQMMSTLLPSYVYDPTLFPYHYLSPSPPLAALYLYNCTFKCVWSDLLSLSLFPPPPHSMCANLSLNSTFICVWSIFPYHYLPPPCASLCVHATLMCIWSYRILISPSVPPPQKQIIIHMSPSCVHDPALLSLLWFILIYFL